MVKFYATWCGHCQEMNPAYERLASHFSNNRRVLIAQVNAPDNQGVHHQYGIRGYPTLKIFDHGNLEDAHCGRDFDSMKNLIESKLRKS